MRTWRTAACARARAASGGTGPRAWVGPAPAAICAALVLLAGCSSPTPQGTEEFVPSDASSVQGLWVLRRGSDGGRDIEPPTAQPVLLEVGDGTLVGSTGCLVYSATLGRGRDGGQITVGNTAGVAVGCTAESMRLENDYMRALEALTALERDGQGLRGTGPEGVELLFDPPDPLPVEGWTGRTWQVQGIGYGGTVNGRHPGSEASLEFHPDGTMTGTTGCQDFTASWTEQDGEVAIADLTLVKDGCDVPELRTQDARIRWVLQDGFAAIGESTTLTLRSADKGLVLRQAPPAP